MNFPSQQFLSPICASSTHKSSRNPGYIGGSVLARLLVNAKPLFDITVLVRDVSKAEKLKSFGVKTVLGSLDDTDKIRDVASHADIVLECVSNYSGLRRCHGLYHSQRPG